MHVATLQKNLMAAHARCVRKTLGKNLQLLVSLNIKATGKWKYWKHQLIKFQIDLSRKRSYFFRRTQKATLQQNKYGWQHGSTRSRNDNCLDEEKETKENSGCLI